MLNLASKINAIDSAIKLRLFVKKTEIIAQKINRSCISSLHSVSALLDSGILGRLFDIRVLKIDGITLDTYKIVVAIFLVIDKTNRVRFFEEIFLLASISPEIVLGIPFFTLSSANIDFLD